MKKKYAVVITLVIIVICTLILLTSCTTKGSKNYEANAGLIAIPGYDNLYYDNQSKVVYFIFN